MFKKHSAPIENFYDHTYKILVEERMRAYNRLVEAIKTCRTKEIKTHLFPELTESYSNAVEEYKQAQYNVWHCKIDYIVARDKQKEEYDNNHTHFVVCKDYADPSMLPPVDEIIDRIIQKGY